MKHSTVKIAESGVPNRNGLVYSKEALVDMVARNDNTELRGDAVWTTIDGESKTSFNGVINDKPDTQ